MLRRFGIIAVLSVVLVASMAAIAAAAVTLHGPLTCKDNGLTLTCSGNASGLGEQPLVVSVTSPATATVECSNPAGNVAPGQTFNTTASGSGTFTADKNGRTNFSVTTTAPTAPAGSCPNNKWTAKVTDVTFGTATITGTQGGTQVFRETVTVT